MPHKHTRGRKPDLLSTDLPPTTFARPLPVDKVPQQTKPRRNARPKPSQKDDDTPRAFTRLLQFKATGKHPKGLDDGVRQGKGKKRPLAGDLNPVTPIEDPPEKQEIPSIRPGERLHEFGFRVDQALPLSGLVNKKLVKGKDPLGIEKSRTKTERKMQKMQKEWRLEDARIKEKREEMDEQLEDFEDPESHKTLGPKSKKRKLKEDDPWSVLKAARNEGPARLNDVVQAPPQLSKPTQKLQRSGKAAAVVANVPKASGSLRKRETLHGVREDILLAYRKLMSDQRSKMRNI
ncbi:MAG: hypothetical protein M1829_006777 [Trizodia sp. TS-e1964]|nr:MAG: hypothetical protein M1829_006777 [Trizodia sp. TS-e1964]